MRCQDQHLQERSVEGMEGCEEGGGVEEGTDRPAGESPVSALISPHWQVT